MKAHLYVSMYTIRCEVRISNLCYPPAAPVAALAAGAAAAVAVAARHDHRRREQVLLCY